MKNIILDITKQQEDSFSAYLSKWSQIVVSQEATTNSVGDSDSLIKELYLIMEQSQPQLIYLSMKEALEFVAQSRSENLGEGVDILIRKSIIEHINQHLKAQLSESVWKHLQLSLCFSLLNKQSDPFEENAWKLLKKPFTEDKWERIEELLWAEYLHPEVEDVDHNIDVLLHFNVAYLSAWTGHCCLYDFCVSELGCQIENRRWNILNSLVRERAYIIPFKKICIVAHAGPELKEAYKIARHERNQFMK